jgi:hypothetical protein
MTPLSLRLVLSAAMVLVVLTAPIAAEETAGLGAPPPFQPPLLGAPGGRISAATRGEEVRQDGILTVVAPLGGGLTATGQPVLVWHLAEPSQSLLRLEIAADGTTDPWLVYIDDDGLAAGFHRLDLGALGLRMPEGTVFHLHLLLHTADGAEIASVGSYIQRVAAEPVVVAALAAPLNDTAALDVLAATGLWWDYIGRIALVGPEKALTEVAAQQQLVL